MIATETAAAPPAEVDAMSATPPLTSSSSADFMIPSNAEVVSMNGTDEINQTTDGPKKKRHQHHHRRKHHNKSTTSDETKIHSTVTDSDQQVSPTERRRYHNHHHHNHHNHKKLHNGTNPEDEAAHAAAIAAAVAQIDVELLPPRVIVPSERRLRWSSRNTLLPISPHQLIDGQVIRSALLLNRKKKKKRDLRFLDKEIDGELEPDNPWKDRQDLKREEVVAAYKEACDKHKVFPLHDVIFQIKTANDITDRLEEISLKNHSLHQSDCDALEEIFRRILFYKVDVDGAIAEDSAAEALFQIFEFYECAVHIVLSNNENIGTCGWQSCSKMLRKSECIRQLDAVNVHLTEEYMTILTRGLRYSYLITLRFDSCHLNGRLLQLLVLALKFNLALRQLYLRDNDIKGNDCSHIETLLRFNSRLSYLDLSNNQIDDESISRVVTGLLHQLQFGKCGRAKKGLESLVLSNNALTRRSAAHLNAAIQESKSLKYLNISSNNLRDETIMDIKGSLAKNSTLLKLDLKSCEITCFGLVELAEILEENENLEVLDLRDNPIAKTGIQSLIRLVEMNKTIKEIYVDEKPKIKDPSKIKTKYCDMVKQLQKLCESNRQLAKEVEAATEDEFEDSEDEMFGDDLDELEEPKEDLPSEYMRYMKWKI